MADGFRPDDDGAVVDRDFARGEMEIALQDSLDRFLHDRHDARTRRDRIDAENWQPDLWRAFAGDLGILGVPLSAERGGLDGGPAEIAAIMECFGRHLVAEPYVSTIVMGTSFLKTMKGTEVDRLLEAIVAGDATVAIAYCEQQSGFDLAYVETRADRIGANYVITGGKTVVLDAPQADYLIVIARTAGAANAPEGLSAFLVDARRNGISRTDYRTIDGGRASTISFTNVSVSSSALIGGEGDALPDLERVIDEATVAICAEACGVMRAMLDQTLDYSRQRKQFGRSIGENQVLQHRMVDMLIELKQASSLVVAGRLKLDSPERSAAVSAVKSRVGRACRFVGQNAIQLHGAIGIADETAISRYFRRALMIEKQFGSVEHHLARYERLQRSPV